MSCVALLAEGVDRNLFAGSGVLVHLMSPSSRRAWIEIQSAAIPPERRTSPSSRRAWIEIEIKRQELERQSVALLAEGVDRNTDLTAYALATIESPSSRRAWIEMHFDHKKHCQAGVALLAEGVDRND